MTSNEEDTEKTYNLRSVTQRKYKEINILEEIPILVDETDPTNGNSVNNIATDDKCLYHDDNKTISLKNINKDHYQPNINLCIVVYTQYFITKVRTLWY